MRATQPTNALFRRTAVPSRPLRSWAPATPSLAPLSTLSARPPALTTRLANQHRLPQSTPRFFSHGTPLQKKDKNKGSTGTKPKKGAPAAKDEAGLSGYSDKDAIKPSLDDPFNLADVEQGFERIARRHEEDLKQLRSGGRFHPDTIGAVLVRPDKKSTATYPLRELAQVAPKGARSISILVSEAELVKAVQSAILGSEAYNQQPQVAEDNELELVMKVEPEPSDALVKRAKDILHRWREDLRAVRHKRDVVNKRWVSDKTLSSDDKRKLDKELQKVQDARMAAIAGKEKEVLKRLAASEGR